MFIVGTNLPHAKMDDSDSPTQASNRVTDVGSNIKEEKQVSEETQRKSEDTVGQGSQQSAAISEKIPANENENVKEATPKENANELNVSDAGHAVSDTADVTSNNTLVAKKDEKMGHVVLQQKAVAETKAKGEKNPSTSQDDQSNRSKGGGTGSTKVDNRVQVPNEDSIPSSDSDLPTNSPDQGKCLKRETLVLKERNDVSAQYDESAEDLGKTARTEEHGQKLGKKGEEREESHKADLKIENRETNKDSDTPDTDGEGSNVDEIAREKLETRAPANKQRAAEENNEDKSATKLNVQGNLNKNKKIKEDESVAQRIAESTAANAQANYKVFLSSLKC